MLTIALVTLGDPKTLTGGYLYHWRVAELAPRHGAQIKFVSFPSWPFPLPLLRGGKVLEEVRRCGAQAILLDSICTAYLAPWLAIGQGAGVPVLGILHQGPGGIGQSGWKARLQAPLDRWAYGYTRRLLVASQSLCDELDFPHKLVVAPGCDVAESVEDPGDLKRGREAALLCVANWARMKDHLSLLEAFSRLPEHLATLHLAGDEDADPAYGQQVAQKVERLGDRVVRHKKCRREQVAGLYQSADVFVLPSLRETYGTVYSEAMACGLPCVGWDTGNLPHLIEDGVHGRVLPAGDIAGLSSALEQLCREPALRARMSQAARQRARAFPSWDETTALIVETVRKEVA